MIEMFPVICDLQELADQLNLQFGANFDYMELLDLMFDDTPYCNDSYLAYHYDEDPVYIPEDSYGYNEDQCSRIALINTYLRDVIPDYTTVLVDVSW